MMHVSQSEVGPLLRTYSDERPIRRSFVIFDRDNTLIKDSGYVHDPEDLLWRDGALQCLVELHERGVEVLIATNQSGIARGRYSEGQMVTFNDRMVQDVAAVGGRIRAIAACPHLPDAPILAYRASCGCRKPASGLFLALMAEFGLLPDNGVAVGDKESDAIAAQGAGLLALDARPPVCEWLIFEAIGVEA